MTLGVRAAAVLGYCSGLVFFACSFAWFGETAGALLGPFGPLVDIGPAMIEAVAFGLTAALASSAAMHLRDAWIPLAAAAGFTLMELVRSSGLMGAPLYQIGAAFVDTPLAPIAAFGGVYTVTFCVAMFAAALGWVVLAPSRRSITRVAVSALAIVAVAGAARAGWPARTVPAGTLRVAAIQGNIRQSVKWEPSSLPTAVKRYTDLTLRAASFKPAFVLWPETVITTDLQLDPALAKISANANLASADRALQAHFKALARKTGAVLAVGSNEATASATYNTLFFFAPAGADRTVYRKRQLVPFAEFLPGPHWLRGAPFASLVSDFGAGTDPGPFDTRLRMAPLICWEADFSDLAQSQAARGARFYAIATDDAWFGESDGPYAQAQIAQLRAVETGRWIVRAAATGISGIIAPDGRWHERSSLDRQAVITGTIGEPQPTVYSRLGPLPVGAMLGALVVIGFGAGRRRRR